MLEMSALRQFRPLIMTPSHDGKFFANYVASGMALLGAGVEAGLPVNFMFHCGESLITRARNQCAARFLADPQWTHLVWIDGDIGYSAMSLFRLLLSDYDIAAGVYPLKRENWPVEGLPAGTTQQDFADLYTSYTANSGRPKDETIDLHIQPDGFVAVHEAPTGFMSIKRDVFTRMRQAYPHLKYVPEDYPSGTFDLHYRFFDVMIDPDSGRYLSEDYAFCRLWNDMGGKVFIDTHSNLSHHGTKIYRGDFARSLARDPRNVVHGPGGLRYNITGLEYLASNPPGPF
jgi:hypothetical protein